MNRVVSTGSTLDLDALSRQARYVYPVNQQQTSSEPWNARLAARVGHRTKKLRQDAGLSAAALSARTASLGHEIKRSVLAEMENGKRTTVTLGDVLVLARALNTPPLDLIAIDAEGPGETEILPGVTVSHWEALDWADGTNDLDASPWLRPDQKVERSDEHSVWARRAVPFQSRRSYMRFVENERWHLIRAQNLAEKAETADGATAELWRARAQLHLELATDAESRARNVKEHDLLRHGLEPPTSIDRELEHWRAEAEGDDA